MPWPCGKRECREAWHPRHTAAAAALLSLPCGGAMFDFDKRELMILAGALIVAVALGVWAAFGIAGYLAADSQNDPLAKAGGLSPAQQRAVETKQ